jgi:hypothetical protein
MSKTDYSLSRIYKIVSKKTKDVYFGCTICELWTRRHLYKKEYQNYKSGKTPYKAYFSIIQYDDFRLELIEIYECKCKQQLKLRLQHWIDRNDCINEKSTNNDELVHPPQKTVEYPRFKVTKKKTDGVVLLLTSSSSESSEEFSE